MFQRPFIILSISLHLFALPAWGETIRLKSQRDITGTIIAQTDRYVDADIGGGQVVRFYFDEIDEVYEDNPPPHSDDRHFLWKMASSEATVYLHGSIHLGRSDMFPLAQTIETAFKKSSVLVVEVDVQALDQAVAQQKILSVGSFTSGERLMDQISRSTQLKLNRALNKYGLTLDQVDSYKPWLVSLTLSVMQIKALGFDEDFGIDRYFLVKAQNDKEIIELESFDEQLQFLDALSDQDGLLEYTLESLDETENVFQQMINAWETGDDQLMEKLVITDMIDQYPDAMPVLETILFKRNIDMVEHIKEFLETDKVYFVVVGSGHLIGEQGIVQLLKDEGYSVQQL